jgi:hypothetical protein
MALKELTGVMNVPDVVGELGSEVTSDLSGDGSTGAVVRLDLHCASWEALLRVMRLQGWLTARRAMVL